MENNFDKSLLLVLKHEGNFVNDPRDPGGCTNLGVTQRVWEEWIGHPVNETIMRGLTPERVGPLYKRKYWDLAFCNDLPIGLDFMVFDASVNMGVGRAVKLFEECLGMVQTGTLGKNVLNLLQAVDHKDVAKRYTGEKKVFYESLKTFPTFGHGWLKRCDEVYNEALTMIG